MVLAAYTDTVSVQAASAIQGDGAATVADSLAWDS